MNILRSAFLRGLCALCGSIAVDAAAQPPSEAPVSVRYKCDNKQSIQVDYNIPGKTQRAIVTTSKPPKGAKSAPPARTWTMKQVVSGSGVRYEDAKKTMVWHSKGPEGSLIDQKTNTSIHCTEYASSR